MDAESVAAFASPAVGRGEALCSPDTDLIVGDDQVVLEEFDYRRTGDADGAARRLTKLAVADHATKKRLRKNLVVLHDDDFTHFARHATEVLARVGLDYETKTVRKGALFYEEFLPPETIFYAGLIATDSRDPEGRLKAKDVLERLIRKTPRVLQVGGDQTIGKGLCAVRFLDGGDQPREEGGR